jgi:hypothetical protein
MLTYGVLFTYTGTVCYLHIQVRCAIYVYRHGVLFTYTGTVCDLRIQVRCAIYVYRYGVLFMYTGTVWYLRIQVRCAIYVYRYGVLFTYTGTVYYLRIQVRCAIYIYRYGVLFTYTGTVGYLRIQVSWNVAKQKKPVGIKSVTLEMTISNLFTEDQPEASGRKNFTSYVHVSHLLWGLHSENGLLSLRLIQSQYSLLPCELCEVRTTGKVNFVLECEKICLALHIIIIIIIIIIIT